VNVTVNGRSHEAAPGESVESLLDRLGLAARYALVERNGEPVERDRYPETALAEGDTLVVARPVAGG
jgi:sulfur carrier protein